jgi:tetratricopeptide (TPR) repeat protein
LVADNLETLFRSTMERLDAQGSAILRGDLSLTLAVRTMDQALLSNLSSRLPDRLRKNFPDLLVKSENETAWKQSQLVFEEYTKSALTRVEAKQDQLILIMTDELKRAREDGRIARQQADTAQGDLAKLTEAYRELLEKLTASPAQPAQQALSHRLAAGDLAGAVELKTKQVQSETDERDRQNDKLAQDQFELGTLHALRFDWPKALEAFREAWKLKHDPTYGAAYAEYANRQGQFDQADAVYDALLAMPLDPADTAAVLNNQANLFSGMLRMREAEQAYHKALSIQRSLAAADPEIYRPEMALTLSNIAVFYRTTQRLREAEQAHEESLSIRRELARTDPDDHVPEVATTLHNLAVLYVTTQRVNEAEAAFEEALSIRRRLAKAQPDAYAADVASTLRDLANLYSDTQRSIDAEPAYCDALATYRRLAEANPEGFLPDVATTLHNLAILYHNTRRISQAESDYKEALAIRWRLAKTHPEVYLPDVAASLNALAVLYRSSNRLTEAEQTFKEALAIWRELAQS